MDEDPETPTIVRMRGEYLSAEFKRRRVEDHIETLKPLIEAWCGGEGYELETRYIPQIGQKVVRFKCDLFPYEWGPIIGDILQGLRNALDNMVFGIAQACGELSPDQARKIYFPTRETAPLPEQEWNQALLNVPDPVREIIKSAQPYNNCNALSHLWVLHRLANIDKHRSAHVVAIQNEALDFWPQEGDGYIPLPHKGWALETGTKLENGLDIAGYAVDEGTEEPEFDMNVAVSFQVRFDEAGLTDRPVLEVLAVSEYRVNLILQQIVVAYEEFLTSEGIQ